MPHILTIVGARPQFIKAAVLSRVFSADASFKETLVHTGQHYDYNMSDVFFEELEMAPPAYNLGIGSGSHGAQTGKMMVDLEAVILKEKPDCVLIYGDTNSTLAGSMVAAKLHIPVAHVEAGLRSFNKKMPEEINRITTDHVSTFLFCPTQTAVDNLKNENIQKGVYLSGDVMYDSVLFYAQKASNILDQLKLQTENYALVTVHRAENTDDPVRLKAIFSALGKSGLPCVLPAHPRLKSYLDKYGIQPAANLSLVDPVSYLDMIQLEKNAKMIITDSGGVQKEAYFFHRPCITMRDETEWVETVSAGWNKIVGADEKAIIEAITRFTPPDSHPDFYGEGNAGEKIAEVIKNHL
ncbi:MAG: UDP-N-acetylglucosamine 2-epimerase (non-hydrolyzing) [Bacteroidetes bacterium]|nr:UDP-N-acetylglucosamine 2-epimerase (non-hydrolyzing) [Bacteroidota bacterium]